MSLLQEYFINVKPTAGSALYWSTHEAIKTLSAARVIIFFYLINCALRHIISVIPNTIVNFYERGLFIWVLLPAKQISTKSVLMHATAVHRHVTSASCSA